MFVEKTPEEIKGLSDNQFESYQEELYKAKQDQSKALEDTIKALKEQGEGFASENEDLRKANAEMLDITKQQGVAISKMISNMESGRSQTQKTDLIKFIERDQTESMKRKAGMEECVIKVAALMTTANVVPNVTDGFNQLFGNYIDTTIYSVNKPDNFILSEVSVTTQPGTESIWYVERANEEGDAAFIGEGDLKPLVDAEWLEKKADIKEVAERWKMSNRVIMHAPAVVSDFRTHADELISSKIDDGVLLGDGTGDNLEGITVAASAFISPSELALFYTFANIFDVINAVATQVRLNNFSGQLTCILNTVWEAKMKGYKNQNGDYIIPPFVSPDGTAVGSVKVLFKNKMPDGNILLGDLKKFNAVFSENVMYFEGWENDDFSKNLSSRKLEAFLGTYLPSSNVGSIVYDDIATIITAIEDVTP